MLHSILSTDNLLPSVDASSSFSSLAVKQTPPKTLLLSFATEIITFLIALLKALASKDNTSPSLMKSNLGYSLSLINIILNLDLPALICKYSPLVSNSIGLSIQFTISKSFSALTQTLPCCSTLASTDVTILSSMFVP